MRRTGSGPARRSSRAALARAPAPPLRRARRARGSAAGSSSAERNPSRARNAGAAEAAVAARILRQVLLVIVLGVVELRRRADLRRDETKAFRFQRLLIALLR